MMGIEKITETYFVCAKCKGLVEPTPSYIVGNEVTEIQFVCLECHEVIGHFEKKE